MKNIPPRLNLLIYYHIHTVVARNI
jgi:hypothetical protein